MNLYIGLLSMQLIALLHYMHEYIYLPKCPLPLGGDWMHACEYGGCTHCMSSECFLLLTTIALVINNYFKLDT